MRQRRTSTSQQTLPLSLLSVLLLLLASCASTQTTPPPPPAAPAQPDPETTMIASHARTLRSMIEGPDAPTRPQVLLLGIFHFENPGLDAHKSKYTFDPFSDTGRQQVEEVLARLDAFAPTKILIERSPQYQADIDTWYDSNKEGRQSANPNEILTIGFALAHRLGHPRVYGFDARAEWLTTTPETQEAFIAAAKAMNMEWTLDDPIDARYMQMYKASDEIEESLTLRQRLRLINNPDALRLSHGAYLYSSGFRLSDGTTFPGPDGFTSAWHNRNLRMYANVQRIAEPNDRILIIVGAGHAPILKHCIESDPLMILVPVDAYLGLNPPASHASSSAN